MRLAGRAARKTKKEKIKSELVAKHEKLRARVKKARRKVAHTGPGINGSSPTKHAGVQKHGRHREPDRTKGGVSPCARITGRTLNTHNPRTIAVFRERVLLGSEPL